MIWEDMNYKVKGRKGIKKSTMMMREVDRVISKEKDAKRVMKKGNENVIRMMNMVVMWWELNLPWNTDRPA